MSEPRLNVLHVITGLNTGGAERMLYRLVRRQVGLGLHPTVISLMDRGRLGSLIEELGVPIHTLGMMPSRFSVNGWLTLRRLIESCSPDVVHSWMYHANLAAYMSMLRQPKRPLLWHIHNAANDLGQHKKLTATIVRLGAPLSRWVNGVIYCGPETARQHEALGYDAGKTSIIPNGTDCAEYRPDTEARVQLRSELGIPIDAAVVGHVARFHPMKDHVNLIRAARLVLKQMPQAHFVLTGSEVTRDNLEITELMTGFERNNIHLLGERKDIPWIMASLDVFVLSSRTESFPLVIAEAMASGVPCVATDVGDTPWIIGDTGMIVPPANPDALANAILNVLSLLPDERQRLARAARERIEREFSLASVATQFSQLYDRVCTG